jgi:hypothetical protein
MVVLRGEVDMKKLISGLLVTMLTLGLLALASSVKPARASPATITVTDDYPTIQLAINAASLGDTVRMKA